MMLLSERLKLRVINADDLPFLYQLEQNPLVIRHNRSDSPSMDELIRKYEEVLKWNSETPVRKHCFIVKRVNDDVTVGKVTLKLNWEDINEWEMGWYFDPAYWGNGYASEAAKRVAEFALNDLNAHRVIAFCNVDNVPSQKIMIRIGMQNEGCLRKVILLNNTWKDQLIYSLLKDDMILS